jgi:hypothetical protein
VNRSEFILVTAGMTARTTEEVFAAARGEVQSQLRVVRDEIARLTTEERALTQALTGLRGRRPDTSSRKAGARKSGRTGKSTSDRVEEVRALLAEGPKSRNELAAALKVSPPRIQQLLAELGSAVTSERDPSQRRGKLWRLKRGGAAVS